MSCTECLDNESGVLVHITEAVKAMSREDIGGRVWVLCLLLLLVFGS